MLASAPRRPATIEPARPESTSVNSLWPRVLTESLVKRFQRPLGIRRPENPLAQRRRLGMQAAVAPDGASWLKASCWNVPLKSTSPRGLRHDRKHGADKDERHRRRLWNGDRGARCRRRPKIVPPVNQVSRVGRGAQVPLPRQEVVAVDVGVEVEVAWRQRHADQLKRQIAAVGRNPSAARPLECSKPVASGDRVRLPEPGIARAIEHREVGGRCARKHDGGG